MLRLEVLIVAALATLYALWNILLGYPRGVDLEIPLRAAARWAAGGQPYLASAFQAPPGPDLPFLYPPVVLPFISPLLALPRGLVLATWVGICLVAGMFALRRLRVPARWWPLVLASPPFAEGIVGGNVQLVLFAAFVGLFFRRGDGPPDLHPQPRDPTDRSTPDIQEGVLATLVGTLKVSQVHPWVFLLRRRPRAALLGAALAATLVLAAMPITGLAIWGDWVAQVRLAANPAWALGGISVGRYLSPAGQWAITLASLALTLVVPRRRAGAWVGLLAVLGAPSLHVFGLLFAVPAWLSIRRELALIAALLVASYTEPGEWIAIAIVAITFALSTRLPFLAEPEPVGYSGLPARPDPR